ncbi:MAG: hypothetical protein SNJ75_12085 [Gemmataceae bacterium]
MYTLTPSALVPEVLLQRRGLANGPVNSTYDVQAEPEVIREHLVTRIRAEIAQGIYDTEEKLQIAFERMLEDIE